MKFLVLIFAALLVGCSTSPQLTVATEQATAIGAALNDDMLNAAEFTICYGASIGSIRRRFGDPERSLVWQALCNPTEDFFPVGIQ
jgi:hypothetical protein